MLDGTAYLQGILALATGGFITAIVAAVRKLKAGSITDDDAIIARLDSDNVHLRSQRDEADRRREDAERRLDDRARELWAEQETAALYRRQLRELGVEPRMSKGGGHRHEHEQ